MAQTLAEPRPGSSRARRPDDGRQILIELTDGGAALAEDRARREGWLAEAIEAELTPEEQDVLVRAVPLRRLAQS